MRLILQYLLLFLRCTISNCNVRVSLFFFSFLVRQIFACFREKEHTYICTYINTNKINATYGGNFEVKNTFSRAKTTSTVVTDKAHAGHKNNMHTGGKIEICTAEDKIIVVSINITKKIEI